MWLGVACSVVAKMGRDVGVFVSVLWNIVKHHESSLVGVDWIVTRRWEGLKDRIPCCCWSTFYLPR